MAEVPGVGCFARGVVTLIWVGSVSKAAAALAASLTWAVVEADVVGAVDEEVPLADEEPLLEQPAATRAKAMRPIPDASTAGLRLRLVTVILILS
jgi:hypothetical protein